MIRRLLLWLIRPRRLAYATHNPNTYTQIGYRIRSDWTVGLNATTGWAAAEVTAATIDCDKPFRIRFEVDETSGNGAADTFEIEYRYKPFGGSFGAWTAVNVENEGNGTTTPSQISRVACIDYPIHSTTETYANGAATTELLTQSSATTFVTGAGVEGTDTSGSIDFTGSSEKTELEYLLVIRRWCDVTGQDGGPVKNSDGDEFEFRLIETSTGPFDTYTATPNVTLNIPVGHVGGVYVETPQRIGPFAYSDGDLYWITEITSRDNRILFLKSTDGGDTWDLAQETGKPTKYDLECMDIVVESGRWLHIIGHQENAGSPTARQILYHRFDMDDDTWEAADTLLVDSISTSIGQQAVGIEQFDNGDLLVVYNFFDNPSGDDHLAWIRRTSGTWDTSGTTFESEANFEYHQVSVVKDAVADKIHIFYERDDKTTPATSSDIFHRSFDFTTGLGARESVTGSIDGTTANESPMTEAVAWDSGGTSEVMVAYHPGSGASDTNIYSVNVTSDGSPETVVQINDSGNDAQNSPLRNNQIDQNDGSRQVSATLCVDPDTDTVYCLWVERDTFDIYYASNVDNGGWSSDTEEQDGVNANWIRAQVFTHSAGNGGAKVIGYIWDQGSGGGTHFSQRYDEIVLSTPTPAPFPRRQLTTVRM